MKRPASRLPLRTKRGERGQILIMFVVMLSLVMLAAAAAIDYGLWLSEKRGIARAADLASLAAVQDLPADPADDVYTTRTAECASIPACDAAFTWAERNGYGEADGATIEVSFFCANDILNPPDTICENELAGNPAFPISLCPSTSGEGGCDTVRVIVEKGAVSLFSGFFGGVDIAIGSSAFAKVEFVVSPVDLAMAIDSSGSMAGDPLTQAQIAARNFATSILGDDEPENSPSQVGIAPYRYCYEPEAADPDDDRECVPSFDLPPNNADCNDPDDSWVLCLGRDLELIHDTITDIEADGSTNVCLGLWAAGEVVVGPGSRDDVERFIVILTDGDNVFESGPGIPPECFPDSASGPPDPGCGVGAGDEHRDLDRCTYAVAEDMKTDNCDADLDSSAPFCIEIYVVGLNVGGTDNPSHSPGNGFLCSGLGGGSGPYDHDVWDRRLLKCVASSTPGTNDHYFETDDASDLPSIFQGIAYEIATRGLTGAP